MPCTTPASEPTLPQNGRGELPWLHSHIAAAAEATNQQSPTPSWQDQLGTAWKPTACIKRNSSVSTLGIDAAGKQNIRINSRKGSITIVKIGASYHC